jgi:hypothetical protein
MILKNGIAALALVFCLNISYSQSVSLKDHKDVLAKISSEQDKEKKADFLYKAAVYYLDKEGAIKTDLDSAVLFNDQFGRISREFDLKSNIARGILLNGKIAAESGISAKAKCSKLFAQKRP